MAATDFTSENVFTNVEAQEFLYQLQVRGEDAIREAITPAGRMSIARLRRLLAAGEALASARGHAPAPEAGSVMLGEWLVASGYTADEGLAARFADLIERTLEDGRWSGRAGLCTDDLQDLLTRLRLPPRMAKRKFPKQDRRSFRELLKWLNSSSGESDPGATFDRQGNASVYLYNVTLNAACKLVNYRTVPDLEVPLNESNEPRELEAGLPILFRGWRNSLKYVSIDDVPNATLPRNRPRYKALASCRDALADLPLLEKFVTIRLYFDDDLLASVCRNPRLIDLEIKGADITRNALDVLEGCRSLRVLSIVRCPGFSPELREELLLRCPQLEILEVS